MLVEMIKPFPDLPVRREPIVTITTSGPVYLKGGDVITISLVNYPNPNWQWWKFWQPKFKTKREKFRVIP